MVGPWWWDLVIIYLLIGFQGPTLVTPVISTNKIEKARRKLIVS